MLDKDRRDFVTGIAGIILAGGASRRFGTNKAATLIEGRPMIAHVADRLAPQVATLAIAGADQSYALACPLLEDGAHATKGPLAGLAAGLSWALENNFTHVVTAPCDVPRLPRNLVRLLASHSQKTPAVLKTPRGIEAACAMWPVSVLPEVRDRLQSGTSLSIVGLLDTAGTSVIQVQEDDLDGSFININTPDDLAKL
ncbi:MAG: molybdenum cofactor guanylyltransferase [Pseudomonadota bacterium]